MECFRMLLDNLAWIEHQFLSGLIDSRKPGCLWGMMRGVGGVRKSIYQSWLAKRLGLELELLCWGFKGVQEEIPSEEIPLEETSSLQIRSVAFPPGQCTSLQLHPCLSLFDQDGHQYRSSAFLKSRPCSLWLVLIPKLRQLRRWKRLWRRLLRCSYKRNSMGSFGSCWNDTKGALQLEDITLKGTIVSCVYYQ